jgi:chaperonin cofactor prefoldin
MNKIHQEEIIDWVKAAIKELDKLDDDRSSRILRDGGKALLKEIEKEKNNY